MVIAAKKKLITKLIIPTENLAEASLVHGIELLGFEHLTDVLRFLEGRSQFTAVPSPSLTLSSTPEVTLDFSDVRGQQELIESITLAAAGGHNLLMIGEPGCGKTMIAQRIPTILPHMTEEDCLEVTKIYSISGILPQDHSLIIARPFRSPHHNVSLNALIGGGANAMPGEVSLNQCQAPLRYEPRPNIR